MITAKSGDESFFGAKNEGGKYLARSTFAAAVVGSTTSEIAGGKFANGAATAAMVHLLNHENVLEKDQIFRQNQNTLTPGDIKINEVGISFWKGDTNLDVLKKDIDSFIGTLGKVPGRSSLTKNLYEKVGSQASGKLFQTLKGWGMTKATVNLKVQFYKGEGSFLGFKWQKWSHIYTIDQGTLVPANNGLLDGYTFTSGSAASYGANRFLNDTITRGLLINNKYQK